MICSDGVEPVTEQTLHVGVVREVLGTLDGVVVGLDHELLAGLVVGAGEGDALGALVVDRVGRHDHVDLAVLDHLLADVGGGLLPLDVLGRDAHGAGDDLGDLDVEALGRVLEAQQAEAGLVELGADGHRAGLGDARPWWCPASNSASVTTSGSLSSSPPHAASDSASACRRR